jgi:hypothetical protein
MSKTGTKEGQQQPGHDAVPLPYSVFFLLARRRFIIGIVMSLGAGAVADVRVLLPGSSTFLLPLASY